MQIGMMGLGRMGANMVRRLMRAGHECVVYDISADAVAALVKDGAVGAASMQEFISKLSRPRTAWLMLPAAITPKIADQVAALMEEGDTIVDGGNSYYHDAVDQAAELAGKGIDFVDVGTSGGVWGLERGYCLMIGGPDRAVKRLDPIFAALAPGADPGATPDQAAGTAPFGSLHCGPSGAGHFVKMVHNGIEYGVMAAYAEGMNILKAANAGKEKRAADAETSPLPTPQYYQFDIDLPQVAEVWRHGSVAREGLRHGRRRRDAGGAGAGAVRGLDRRSGAGPVFGAVRPLRLAGRSGLRRQAPVGHALRLRRPCREEGLKQA